MGQKQALKTITKKRIEIKDIFRILWISFALAKTRIKVKTSQTGLGYFWYFAAPLGFFGVLYTVFHNNLGSGITEYPLYLLCGIIYFNFFRFVTTESTYAFTSNESTIKSYYFPKSALIIAIVLEGLLLHIIEIIFMITILSFFKTPHINLFLYPLILLPYTAFILGTGLLLATTTVFIRDIHYLWQYTLSALWIITPIFYSKSNLDSIFILKFNPLDIFIQQFRDLMITSTSNTINIIPYAITLGIGIITLYVGIKVYVILSPKIIHKI